MTFVITQACIDVMDQSCVAVCPVDCIYHADDDRMCYIRADECIDCAVCEAACPVGAIFRDADVPAESAAFTDVNRLWFEDRDAARRLAEQHADA